MIGFPVASREEGVHCSVGREVRRTLPSMLTVARRFGWEGYAVEMAVIYVLWIGWANRSFPLLNEMSQTASIPFAWPTTIVVLETQSTQVQTVPGRPPVNKTSWYSTKKTSVTVRFKAKGCGYLTVFST